MWATAAAVVLALVATVEGLAAERSPTDDSVAGVTYSVYGRGAKMTGGSYYWLDPTALGRQEEWEEEPKGRADAGHSATPDFSS